MACEYIGAKLYRKEASLIELQLMRNSACRLKKNEDFSSTNPRNINSTPRGISAALIPPPAHHHVEDDPNYVQSSHCALHLKSLVEDFLEPARSQFPSSHNSQLLFHSNYIPHDHLHCEVLDHTCKSFIHEIHSIMQNGGADDHDVELIRREVMRAATKKEEIKRMHSSNSEHGPPLCSYEQLKVVVLGHLRKMGYNAAICTSKRDQDLHKNQHKGHFPTEEYEYMDVIVDKGSNSQVHHERLIIDLRFRSEFEIARPSTAYVELLKVVPLAYVGSPRVLQKLLKLLSEAMKNSFESQGMPLPPWRKLSFLNSKWLSPTYSRSIFASPPHTPPISNTTKRGNALSHLHQERH